MKQIIIYALLFAFLFACGSKSETSTAKQPTQTDATTTATAMPDNKAIYAEDSIDAVTSATAVSNNTIINGVLTIPAQNHATVTLSIDGTVKSVELLPGQFVQKGDILVTLENPQFIELQYTYLDAQAQCEFLAAEYERQRNLSQEDATSKKRLQQSKAEYESMKARMNAASVQLDLLGVSTKNISASGIMPTLQIKAPISGYVAVLNVNQGKHITAGETICEIVNKNNTLIKLTAFEKDLDKLKIGNKVSFRVNGITNQTFSATILTIGQQIDATNRSIEVYAKSSSNHPNFRPGMYVTAQID